MTKGKQRQSLRGAVLIMVLTVMVVLIIMLMATLTVVTTAGQRIYTKFEENQAYYTARSALDVFTDNLLGDAAYIAYTDGGTQRNFNYTKSDGTPDSKPMKQGLALQLDLYKIASQNDNGGGKGSGEDFKWLENAVVGDGTFASGSNEETYYTLDSGVDHTGEYADGLPYIEYDIAFPTIASSTNSYGKIVDIDKNDSDGDGDTTDQIARIRVEVLDRKLNTATEYTEAEVLAAFNDPTGTAVPSKADIQAAVLNGSRTKDYMKIKVTATVQMMDTEGVAVVIFETNEVDAPAASNAINSLGGITGSGAGLVAAGGASSLNTGLTLIDASGTAGSVFSVGSIEWNSTGSSSLDDGAYVYAKDGIKFTNSQDIIPVGQDSFMYTDGTFDITSNFSAGTASNPINIIADKFQYSNDITVNGNIYANEFYVSVNGNLKPPAGTNKVYVKDLYLTESAGRIYIEDGKLQGDVMDTDAKTLKNNFVIYGDIYIYRNGAYENCTAMAYENIFLTEGSGTFDILSKTPVENGDGLTELQVELPADLASGSKDTINLPTVESKYSEYFSEDSFDDNGDLINKAGAASAYDIANLQQTTVGGEEAYYKDNNFTVPATPTLYVYDATDPDNILTGTEINESGILRPGAGNITIDTTAGNLTIQLQSGTYYHKIKVIGTNTVNFLLPETTTGMDLNYNFQNGFEVVTEDITNAGGQNIENGTTKAPKINFYAGTQANVNFNQNGAFVTGYFYMPRSKMTNNSGNNGVSKVYEYNGTTTTKNYFIVGSVTCLEYDTGGSNAGVCYIDPDSGAANPGEPHLSVQAAQYARK